MAEKLNDLSGKEWLQSSFSIWRDLKKNSDERKLNHPASFPQDMVEKIIKIFTHEDAKILDPFLGSGTTILAALNCNRYAVGIELSKEYCDLASSRIEANNTKYVIENGDSSIILDKYADYDFDLCVTSPPYWDILNMKRTADNREISNYGNDDIDLGNIGDYILFIDKLKDIFLKVKTTLKKDGYCVINVMDIRKQKKFYPFHMDVVIMMEKIGYELEDIIIWDRQSDYNNMKPLGYPYKFRVNKVHEYILIFSNR